MSSAHYAMNFLQGYLKNNISQVPNQEMDQLYSFHQYELILIEFPLPFEATSSCFHSLHTSFTTLVFSHVIHKLHSAIA